MRVRVQVENSDGGNRGRGTGRQVLLWVMRGVVAACVVGFASLFLKVWLAVVVGIVVTAGLFALPTTNPYGRD